MTKLRKAVATLFATGLITAGAVAPTAGAVGPIITGGLVNVTIVDAVDVSHNTVQLPIAVAANVCDVDINVLAADLADDGQANCTARAGAQANR